MGCVASKQSVSVTPAVDHSGMIREDSVVGSGRSRVGSGGIGLGLDLDLELKKLKERSGTELVGLGGGSELGEPGRASANVGGGSGSVSFRLGNLKKYVEGEQVAAGWPAWLSAVAGEAIQGWVPLRAESFVKLEKIGQGTYSNVFKARDLGSGRIVALKKVRFDNFEPESVRFMAREINILRRLDHPNIIKLEGIITSKLSCSIYLVFEYMEHDVAGLLSCPDIKFNESQIKCFMKQLLYGVQHCHSRGVMHRDIKGANLLVNNDGILKVADFGLSNFCNFGKRHPLTSRVVTLWYRPPELLLGSTDYGASVDLWSVGCVFAELLIGRPILQGRTEVEQMHKIFKLCGSPPDDYWKKSKHPHATLFRPQHQYTGCLWETFKDLPRTAVSLIETLLTVEPQMRGTASSALASEYFTSKPYACDPSSLPKYPPSKEIDAKHREEARKKRATGRSLGPETARKTTRKQNGIRNSSPEENIPMQSRVDRRINGENLNHHEGDTSVGQQPNKSSLDEKEESYHSKNASQEDIPFSGPLQVSGSSGFAWAKRRMGGSSVRSRSRSTSRSYIFEPSMNLCNIIDSSRDENGEVLRNQINSMDQDSSDTINPTMVKQWNHIGCADSFDASDGYHSQELSAAVYQRDYTVKKRSSLQVNQDQGDKIEFSGPLLTQSRRIDELLKKHERQIRQAVRRSWFQRVRRH